MRAVICPQAREVVFLLALDKLSQVGHRREPEHCGVHLVSRATRRPESRSIGRYPLRAFAFGLAALFGFAPFAHQAPGGTRSVTAVCSLGGAKLVRATVSAFQLEVPAQSIAGETRRVAIHEDISTAADLYLTVAKN